jgi:ABC-2 type transport system permease protein
MRILKFLLQKEFRQVFRDASILRLMFVMPVIQLVLLPLAANYEVKNVLLGIVDHDHSDFSKELANKLEASNYFKLVLYGDSFEKAMSGAEKDKLDVIIEVPQGFEKNLVRENNSTMFMAVNAVNGARANIGAAYVNSVIKEYNQEIRLKWIQTPKMNPLPSISTAPYHWFNVHLNYAIFMVPGILVVLLTMVGANLSALNIVREKEIGTIEQINVTPVKKYQFILGKLIPFWVLGQIVLTIGLIISRVVYGIVPVGHIGLIYVFSSVFLMAVLGMGLLLSTYAENQQQAMLISFFLMMIFILMGGLYTSIDSMPQWAQVITWFNPVKYFIEVMRMVIMKGSGFLDILPKIGIVFSMALFFNSWAIINYRKRA